jgi:hypothetical protein
MLYQSTAAIDTFGARNVTSATSIISSRMSGILEPFEDRTYRLLFVAREILAAIEGEPATCSY